MFSTSAAVYSFICSNGPLYRHFKTRRLSIRVLNSIQSMVQPNVVRRKIRPRPIITVYRSSTTPLNAVSWKISRLQCARELIIPKICEKSVTESKRIPDVLEAQKRCGPRLNYGNGNGRKN